MAASSCASSLFAPGTGQVIAASRGEAPLDTFGTACTDALNSLAAALGIAADAGTPPLVSELASTTRARRARGKGRLFEAWRAVQGKLSPVAMAEREALAESAHRSGDPASERARVLAAQLATSSARGRSWAARPSSR